MGPYCNSFIIIIIIKVGAMDNDLIVIVGFFLLL